jgi:hypothetical protein
MPGKRVARHGLFGLAVSSGTKRGQAAGSILERPSGVVVKGEPTPVCDVISDCLGDPSPWVRMR